MLNRALQYLLYFIVWISSEALSMWGQFSTLKYPDMGMVEAFLRVIPFAWADWAARPARATVVIINASRIVCNLSMQYNAI